MINQFYDFNLFISEQITALAIAEAEGADVALELSALCSLSGNENAIRAIFKSEAADHREAIAETLDYCFGG